MAETEWTLRELYAAPRGPSANAELFSAGGTVSLYEGESTDASAILSAYGAAPRLIYIDPPFATNRAFNLRVSAEVGGETASRERVAYRDQWEDGLDGYLLFMRGVLESLHGLLRDDGSLLLHCDQRSAPYLAVCCDQIFGRGDRVEKHTAGFRGELIWHYGLGGSSPRSYPRKHDTILWYSKSDNWYFDPPMIPARSQRMAGQMKKMPDVFDIASLNNMAKERCGYPTQKPLKLLEMLINAHSEPDDLVLDAFSGSGTTAVAAGRTGRNVIAIDRSDDAIAMTRDRVVTEAQQSVLRVYRRSNTPATPTRAGADKPNSHRWREYRGDPDAQGVFQSRNDGLTQLVRTIDGDEFFSPFD